MKDLSTCIVLIGVIILHSIGMLSPNENVYFLLEALSFVILFGLIRAWVKHKVTQTICDWCMGLALSSLIDEFGCLILHRCDIFKPGEFSSAEWLVTLLLSLFTLYRIHRWKTAQNT